MNIKYVPQKSEKFSFTGILVGCVASIIIFSLYCWFVNSYLYHNIVKEGLDGEKPYWANFSILNLFLNIGMMLVVKWADTKILKKFHRYCNRRFLIVYVVLTILLGFYTKLAYSSNNLSFLDLVSGLMLISLVVVAKILAIQEFKENDFYCNNCNRWPEKIEFRLYAKDFELISQKFNDDVNCLLSLPVIDVSSIEIESKYKKMDRDAKYDPLQINLITKSIHLKVKIDHCVICNKLSTIKIYSVRYKHHYSIGGGFNNFCEFYNESDEQIGSTFILTTNQFQAFQLKKNETKTDLCEILEKSMNR